MKGFECFRCSRPARSPRIKLDLSVCDSPTCDAEYKRLLREARRGPRPEEPEPRAVDPEEAARAAKARELLIARHEVSRLEDLLTRARGRLRSLEGNERLLTMFDD